MRSARVAEAQARKVRAALATENRSRSELAVLTPPGRCGPACLGSFRAVGTQRERSVESAKRIAAAEWSGRKAGESGTTPDASLRWWAATKAKPLAGNLSLATSRASLCPGQRPG